MKMRDLLSKLRHRSPSKPKTSDWSTNWTPRDWADLPVHHPRRDDDAR